MALYFAATVRFDLDLLKMIRQGGCCTAVVVQNEIKKSSTKWRKAYLLQ